jgi:hypothetical protein
MVMKDIRDQIYHLMHNDSVVISGDDSLALHLAKLQMLTQEMAPLLAEEYGSKIGTVLEYLRLALECETSAARILAEMNSAADTPETRIALAAIRQCSKAIRQLAYRRLEVFWEVLALRDGTRDKADLAEDLLDELHHSPVVY